jgi:hypothetical protein
MLTNRASKFFTGLLILAVAFVSLSFVTRDISSKKSSGKSLAAVSNTYLPLPPGKQTQLFNAARGYDDYYQRQKSLNASASAARDAYPDYYARHRDLSAQAISSVDLTDYHFRHKDK